MEDWQSEIQLIEGFQKLYGNRCWDVCEKSRTTDNSRHRNAITEDCEKAIRMSG